MFGSISSHRYDELEGKAYDLGALWAAETAGSREYPLSGEWSGESMGELLFDPLGVSESDDWGLLDVLADAFEDGYYAWSEED